MNEYQKPYYFLFNKVSDVIHLLAKGEIENATYTLLKAQVDAEELFVSWGEEQDVPEQE